MSSQDLLEDARIQEAPSHPCIFPMPSTFILFSIDYVATVEGIEDEFVQKAAREMKPKRYLGYVDEIMTLNTARPWIKYEIVFITRSLPERDEDNGIESDMCLPILPNMSHPTGREPIKPSKPLPFDNCYTHSHILPATVRARSCKRTYGDAIMIPFTEAIRDQSEATDDLDRMEELRAMRGVRSDTEMEMEVDEDEDLVDTPQECDKGECDQDENGNLQTSLDPLDVLGLLLTSGIPDDSVTAITNISYNLEECPHFAQPSEFYAEEDELTRLIRDAKIRAIERAKRIDEKTFGPSQTTGGVQDQIKDLRIRVEDDLLEHSSTVSNPNAKEFWLRPWAKLKAWFV